MTALSVNARGMVTALGFNAPASLAALRAGISGVRELPWVDFESGEQLRGAKISLPQWSESVGKLADLAAAAIEECLTSAGAAAVPQVPLLIGVAAPQRPGRFEELDEELLDAVAARLGSSLHPCSALYSQDQIGCANALLAAQALLNARQAVQVIVAGVDSYLHHVTLDSYLERRRIMTPSNSNGFFPGEAACAVLVERSSGRVGELLILSLAFDRETATIEGHEPFRGAGLTRAVQQALGQAGVEMREIAYRLTDLSGEHYKFKEAAFVAGRLNGGERLVPLELWHPVEYLGEIGAAVLPCLLAQVMHAAEEGYAPGRLALCHIGSDAGERAALVVGVRGASDAR